MDVAVRMEADGEPYVLLGHSHGGSVIAAALQSAVARRKRLERLTRWISVGTPFVNMRKEVFLFSRIPLVLQAIYVALLLFVVMFLVPMALGLAAGEDTRSRYMGQFGLADLGSLDGIATLGLTILAVSSVFILFYVFLRLMDRRMLHMYARSNIGRARTQYGPKWLGLTHEDDEVVQGLRSLGSTRFHIFHRSFFVPIFTALAVFALPVAYVVLLFSPSAMSVLTEYLKTNVYRYQAASGEIAKAKAIRDEIRSVRREMRAAGLSFRDCFGSGQRPGAKRSGAEGAVCNKLRAAQRSYRELRTAQPDLPRTLRFEAAYLDPRTGRLQGDGHDIRVNSWMLFNLINDSVSRALGVSTWLETDGGRPTRSERQLMRSLQFIVPALIVPLLFAISAVLVLSIVRRVGSFISGFIAQAFDRITWRQIRRSALGNDTTSEIASNAVERPPWIETSFAYLPADLAERISAYSDRVAAESLGKFRGAISTLVLSDAPGSSADIATRYFSWKELVHSAYFDVPEFRKLVAYAIAQSEGFSATAAFKADPDYGRVAAWYDAVSVSVSPLGTTATVEG